MKQICILFLTLLQLLVFTIGCTSNDVNISNSDNIDFENSGSGIISTHPIDLSFKSIEELQKAHRSVISGEADWELAELAEATNFALLEKLYFPNRIPSNFELYSICVSQNYVNFHYYPKEAMKSSEAIDRAGADRQYIVFYFTRFNFENPLDGIMEQFGLNERDLINGSHIFIEPNSFIWSEGNEQLILDFPFPPGNTFNDRVEASSVFEALGHTSINDLMIYTKTDVIHLR